jgi:hypothetical protein
MRQELFISMMGKDTERTKIFRNKEAGKTSWPEWNGLYRTACGNFVAVMW